MHCFLDAHFNNNGTNKPTKMERMTTLILRKWHLIMYEEGRAVSRAMGKPKPK